jgi:hypothetical protein
VDGILTMPGNELEITETTGGVEEAAHASSDAPARAEQRDAGERSAGNGHHATAETRTRQEYADDMRGQGQPIAAAERPGRDTAPADQPASQLRDAPAPGQISMPDLAEPRDRETYANDIRAESTSPIPDSPPASDRATPAGDRSPGAEPSPADQARAEQVAGEPDQTPERGEAVADRYEKSADAGWPSQADRDRWHAMYQEFLDSNRTGRDQGVNVVGDKPDRSPSDRSGLPPTGEELLEMEPKESRAAALRRQLYKPESISDIKDVVEDGANGIQQFFERPPTGSHADVPVSAPQISQHPPETASAGDLTMAALTLGILVFEAGRRIHHKLGN